MVGKHHITVMAGGPGEEREVSLRSGAGVARALRSRGHTVSEIDPREPGWKLPPETEVVFLALHGKYGEDGTVQRELDQSGARYTGCDAESSRIGFDKVLTKERCIAAGVATARYVVMTSPSAPWPMGWNPPVVLKPVCQGSSVGLQFVDRVADWSAALTEAMRYDARVVVEEKIIGRECTVGILGDQVLPIIEVRPKGVYDYVTKYSPGSQTEYFCPAPFEPELTQAVQETAMGAFRAIGGRDYGRVDVIVRGNGQPMVLEVNTLPGMTETSSLPKAAKAAGIDYPDLCERMVELALRRK